MDEKMNEAIGWLSRINAEGGGVLHSHLLPPAQNTQSCLSDIRVRPPLVVVVVVNEAKR